MKSNDRTWDEFSRGWKVLVVGLIGVTTSAGVMPLYSFGAIVVPLQQEFGWTRGQVQTTLTFFFVSLVLGLQLGGVLLKRFGIRRVALASLALFGAAYLLLSQLNGSLWMLYLAYLLLCVAGAGTLQVTWTMIVNLWFEQHRGLALAIILSGTGLASLLLVPFLAWVMEHHGWRGGFVALGLVPVLITLPIAWLWLPDRGPVLLHHSQRPTSAVVTGIDLRAALRSYRFWVMTVALSVVVIGILGMITSIVPLLRDKGVSLETAAFIYSAVGLTNMGGRILTGWLIDRFWAPAIATVMLTLPALGCLLFGVLDVPVALLLVAAALIGVGAGAEYDVSSFLVARYFGMADYSRIFGAKAAIIGITTAAAPFAFGHLYDRTGSYEAMLWICGLGFLFAPAALLTLGAYPREDG